mmetsp:Transcript_64869/g.120682  ORF Transcript_64869/g.120682 Transcript_64869/m.120682 type:complete len:519 (-) Transcript_64869:74-1630(-)
MRAWADSSGSSRVGASLDLPEASGASSSCDYWHNPQFGLAVCESPSVHSGRAPSESSWHDDASSSLTCSAGDQKVTVNTQRLRMGEHLKGKLEAMVHQRFDHYLRIMQVLQNDTGKLAALECELAQGPRQQIGSGCSAGQNSRASTPTVRINISCNEDGTFLVYAFNNASSSSTAKAEEAVNGMPSLQSAAVSSSLPEGAADTSPSANQNRTAQWVEQVCAFGTSGRCHSLTALFHFGHGVWKQLFSDQRPPRWRSGPHGQTPEHIAEEEERLREDMEEEMGAAVPEEAVSSRQPVPSKVVVSQPTMQSAAPAAPCIGGIFEAAQQASDLELLEKSLSLCDTGLQAAEEVKNAPQIQQYLLLRASVHARLRSYDAALHDAEELIRLQPTCAEGYYWQSVALQGKRLNQEALESLMSALEYDPQNNLFQQAFTSLFEDMSASANHQHPRSYRQPGSSPGVYRSRGRGAHPGDALSTTTQATHLSSRSTTPTEVSSPSSRSSSNDSAYPDHAGTATEDQP